MKLLLITQKYKVMTTNNIKKYVAAIIILFLIACSSNNKDEKSTISNSTSEDKKIEDLLPLLNVELMDECAAFPSFIENPYQEFPDIPAKAGLFFDGPTRKCNQQYSYYSNKIDLNNFHLSWKTELGAIDSIKISSYKLKDRDVPFLKANWTSSNGNNTAELNITPVLDHEEAPEYSGTIQYALFTKYWRIIGFRKIGEDGFYNILEKMGEIQGIDTKNLKIKKISTTKESKEDVAQPNNTNDNIANYTIDDPDGYTNVREERSAASKILFKLNVGDRISVVSKEGAWWEIMYKEKKGFVHKSRIVEVE